MIGIIITGHGQFSEGLHSSLKLIAGDLGNVKHLNFNGDISYEELSEQLREIVNELKQNYDKILVGADLIGGTPFKAAVTLAQEIENMGVICPINLPMLLELSFTDGENQTLSEIFKPVSESEMAQPQLFEKLDFSSKEDEEDSEGI